MDGPTTVLITIGALLLLGLFANALGHRTPIPRITFLLIFGFLIGPSALNLLPNLSGEWFPIVSNMALAMIGFLLGEKLSLEALREYGRFVIWISILVVLVTAVLMTVGLLLVGAPLIVALILAGIAPATAPTVTADVVREVRADGRFTQTLLGIVAVDDAWGLIIFGFMLAIARALQGHDAGFLEVLRLAAWNVGGAFVIGIVLGIPLAYLTGRIQPGEPTLLEGLGAVFLCGGIAIWCDTSFLLTAMIMGAVVANFARHHEYPFHAIEGIEEPIMVLFFVLTGASLHLEFLWEIGLIGSCYLVFRVLGRFVGVSIGSAISHADPSIRRWMGMALIPQAGVALGMALAAIHSFPDLKNTILPIVISATVIFEIGGPILTRRALTKAGDVGAR